ncbi:GntR family transcriptional regulator [Castellaniella sp.]|uniref:GntR family transcriptional regulator n=1 Tax=Castellaniella sp. TaxID=1955812 RepID=UPI002AFFEE51|nr:GntR family transcriptional regulator [Castellaniella sp.]
MLQLKPQRSAAPDLQAPRASSLRKPKSSSNSTEVQRVYDAIFDAAMDRRLLPGAKLTEATLCSIFDCSRSTVRTALAQLAHDKIVLIEPNRGARVWQASAKEIRDVFAMRRALEGIAIDQLVRLDDLDVRLKPLDDMVSREQQAYEQGDRTSWLRLSNAFHVELARVLDNQVLIEMLSGLCARTTLIIALGDGPEGTACSYVEHQDILGHIRQRDAQGAKSAMDHHLQDCEQRMETPATGVVDPWSAFSVAR